MALLRFLAELGLSTSKFSQGLSEVEKQGGVFAKRFSNSMRQTLTAGFSVGFLGSQVREVIRAADEMEGAISDSARSGLMTANNILEGMRDQWRVWVGTVAGGTMNLFSGIEGMMGNWVLDKFGRAMGLPFKTPNIFPSGPSEAQLNAQYRLDLQNHAFKQQEFELTEKLAELKKELYITTLESNRKEMTDEQRKASLLREQQQIMEKIVTGTGVRAGLTGDARNVAIAEGDVDAMELLIQWEKLRAEIAGIKSKPLFQRVGFGEGANDPLARIGGGLSRGDVRVATYMERTAKATEETANNTGRPSLRIGGR